MHFGRIVFFLCFYRIVNPLRNTSINPQLLARLGESDQDDDLNWLLTDVAIRVRKNINCLLVITDNLYHGLLKVAFLQTFRKIPIFLIRVKDYEDMLAPNYWTLSVIKEARSKGCNAYIILIANGQQVGRLLRFGDKYRVLDTRAQFIILHDNRLFTKDIKYLWKKIVSVLFIRKYAESLRYELSTVPYPAAQPDELTPHRVDSWKAGKFQKNFNLFWDKTADLRGELLKVATFEHMPSVVKNHRSEITEDDYMVLGTDDKPVKYDGLEIQILKSISDVMNFEVTVYETENSDTEAWGMERLNGTFSGLYGEVKTGKADIVLGNFHYSPYNLHLMDLSRPYTTMCFTFLTPESTTDNSWKTLIAPFRLYMWIAILMSVLGASLIFTGLARIQLYLDSSATVETSVNSFWKDILVLWHQKKQSNMLKPRKSYPHCVTAEKSSEGLYLFYEIGESLLSTYSMSLLVSLPKMPTGWSLRMMTGWWYLFCLLVTVAYRASMTAILARPAQRVTIDTLDELAASPIGCGAWGEQTKQQFSTSLDSAGQRVGEKLDVIYDAEAAIANVAAGHYAYYENIHYLHHAKVKEKLAEAAMKDNATDSESRDRSTNQDLHIMGNCAINIPVSLGLEKNSPLKPRVDVFLQRVIEAGLIKKWLFDVMIPTTVAEAPLIKTETKALMDLKKFQGALIALASGLGLASIAPKATLPIKRARMLLEIGLLAIAAWLLWKALAPDAETVKLGNAIPGPDSLPVIGNLFNIPLTGKAAMDCQAEWEKKYGSVVRLWMGNLLVVQLFNPDDVEVLLKSTTQIKKAKLYEFVHPWLGTGLLTSTGPKWRMRRKAITPTFHFKILEDFIDIFNRNGNIFVDCLKSKIGQGSFDVLPYVTAYTMDIICETAMGTRIGAQAGNNVDYRNAVRELSVLIGWRMNCPLVHSDFAYWLSGGKKKQDDLLKILKGQTEEVIRKKEKESQNQKTDSDGIQTDEFGIKKKSAFLELLIQMRKEANPAFQTDEDVREEVDTFMFEGHDTTTAGICFALDCLAGYPQYQDKIYEELKVKYSAADCNPTMDEINEFKYLDMFLKEVLRLCPSVPNIARQLTEPLQLASGYTLPAGCLAVVNFYLLHRNKIHWPTPEVFDPENFAPETSRHPFAYVPFSAGPRNCIGQKFAILEMKLTLIKLIVNFKIERDPSHEVIRDCHLVLQSLNGHKMKFSKRE
ncbi:Ligand-gated ion channel [Nesidiocoris tenuis]|uniref:Ligand-gated ion channel n=1 Tax=Nesidiocoris tenuis TaxID=355587 RepID=A0ABN7A6X3_9HEMI|nr:Ligand-gated ion channel [Nesidiocoris tenuis]